MVLLSAWLDVFHPVRGQPGGWLLPIFMLMTLGTVWEMSGLLSKRLPITPMRILMHSLVALACVLVPLGFSWVLAEPYPADAPIGRVGWIAIGAMLASFSLAVDSLLQFSKAHRESGHASAERVAMAWLVSIAIVLYTVAPMSMWWSIRMHGDSATGMANLIGIVVLTKMADAGAYFVGKRFGRTKLSPVISPGKTVEGLLGGFAASSVAAYICYRGIFPTLGIPGSGTLWGPAVLACMLTAGGLVGDLTESMIKRTVEEKDSGAQLPGLGGVWDVTDSLLPAAVLGYLGILAGLT